MTERLRVRLYTEADYEAVCRYSLPEEQAVYTSLPLQALEWVGQDTSRRLFMIYAGEELAGGFVLASHQEAAHYTDHPDAILFKSFSIDSRYQRKGYGLEALRSLPEVVKEYALEGKEIVLTVHYTNLPAISLYLKAGFEDRGLRYAGECGEEWILHMAL